MKVKAIISALMLMACGMASAQTKTYLNVETAPGVYKSFEVNENLKISWGEKKEVPPTKGTAKRTGDIDVNWVQLWADGPKFAEYNVGASSATDLGITMTFTEATSAEYVWGANWCTPSKDDMEHLMTAAMGVTDDKVKCEYTQENSIWGFKFTGLTDGYTGNSVFFPAQGGDSDFGYADYWSATADGSKAWYMELSYYEGEWFSDWYSGAQSHDCLVRPVLK